MTHKSPTQTLIVAAVLMLLPAVTQAGPIFLPGKLEGGKFVPDKNVKKSCYSVRYSTITTTVDGNTAATRIQETIAGPQEAVRTVCLIPLPEGTDPRGAMVAAGIPGGDHAVLPTAALLAPQAAQKLYESLAGGLDSVELLSHSGRPAILVPRFELKGKVEITVQFNQKIRERTGMKWLECPMPAVQWAAGPVGRLSVAVTLRNKKPLRAIFSPTHSVNLQRDGLHKAVARVKTDNYSGSEDFRLGWVADRDALGLRLLAHRAPSSGNEGEGDGYFMLVGNPTGGDDDEATIDKDVVFVLDTSGSMRGEKIEQARAAIEYCLDRLSPGDRFNIVTFGTEVASFRNGPVACSKETLAGARAFVENVVAKGRTNISGALAKALSGKPAGGRPRITIFLTDGTPTAGELVPEKIVESVKSVKPRPTRIFVMGVGHDVNAHLLDKLAEATDGSSQYVAPDEEIDAKVAALYDRLSHPVLTNVLVDCGKLKTHSVYPKKLPVLFKGSEIMLFGRYKDGGRHTFTISGTLAGRPTSYTCTAALPRKAEDELCDFVAPLWAARKIGYLLQEIRLHGENDELITEVVRLSKKFGVVTEYTEFIASAHSDVSADVALNETRRRMNMANSQQAGQWAFNQARNDKQLQNRLVAAGGENFYVDRRGRTVRNDNIRQFGQNVFYLRDGQWVDANDAGSRKTRVVKLFGKEYNDLVRNNRRFARAQKLGWAVSINVGDQRIVVEKDGRQKSEKLLKMQQRQEQDLQQQQPAQNRRNLNQLQQIPRQQLRNLQINQAPNNDVPNNDKENRR